MTVLAGWLAGCAGVPVLPPSARVAGVPHFAQTALACGPAALASLLHVAGHPHDVDLLSSWMITPGLGGSLQSDLLGAARRAGTLPVRIGGDLSSLRVQLAHARPVLALLNLGLPRWPQWHYVVVSALDAEAARVTVGDPDGRPEAMRIRSFQRAWDYADGWAIVVLRPGDAPTGLALADYLEAVVALESIGAIDAAALGYAAGLAAWPRDNDLRLGAGNVAASRGELVAAGDAFALVLADLPHHVAALNNLAEVRRRQDRLPEARVLAEKAQAHAGTAAERAAIADTLAVIARCGASR